MIGRRLDRISESWKEALAIASAIGPEFGFSQLHSILEEAASDRSLEFLEEGMSGQLIKEILGATGAYPTADA